MSILNYKKRFYQLMESQIGDVKPIISENEIKEDDIDLSNTYLSKDEISKRKKETSQSETIKSPKVVDLTGKIFKDLETTTGEDYISGLDFERTQINHYKVKFSSEFIEDFFSIPSSEVYKNLGPYGDEHGDQPVPLILKVGSQEYTIQELLNNIYINNEGYPTNRIHFGGGVGSFLEGTGLGYLIYQQFIKYLGYGSSMTNASNKAQVVWSKLAKDPDFYSFILEKGGSQSVYVISKTNSLETPESIVLSLLKTIYSYSGNDIRVILGSEIKKDFPEIEKMFSNPDETVLNSLMNNLKKDIEFILQNKNLKDLNDVLPNRIEEISSKIINILTSETKPPYKLGKLIYNDVKELFDKFVGKYFVENTVDLNGEVSMNGIPYWKRKNKEGKQIKRENFLSSEWDDGRPYHMNFEISIDLISKFFHQYFVYLEYTEKISSTFQ